MSKEACIGLIKAAVRHGKKLGNNTLSEIIEGIGTGEFIITPFYLDSKDSFMMECYQSGKDDAAESRPSNFELIFGDDKDYIYFHAYELGYLEMKIIKDSE